MVSTCCFCSILIKFGFYWQIWLEVSNFKFQEKSVMWSWVDTTEGLDMTEIKGTFRVFDNASSGYFLPTFHENL